MQLLMPQSDSASIPRIQAEINQLQKTEPPLTLRVTHRQGRTLIYIQTVSRKQVVVDIEDQSPQDRYSPKEMNLNEYLFEQQLRRHQVLKQREVQSRAQLWKVSKKMKEDSDEVIISQGSEQQPLIFLIILYHDLYPFQAPFITIARANVFPPLDNFTNYYYSIMMTKIWWPLLTLKEIVSHLPHFAFKLLRINKEGSTLSFNRHYSINQPMHRQDLEEDAQGMLLLNGEPSHSRKRLGVRLIGLTTLNVLIFKKAMPNEKVVEIEAIVKTRCLKKIVQKESKSKNTNDIIMSFANEEQTAIKFEPQSLSQPLSTSLRFYCSYYQLLRGQQPQRTGNRIESLIDSYRQFLQLGDALGNKAAVEWGKKKLQRFMYQHTQY